MIYISQSHNPNDKNDPGVFKTPQTYVLVRKMRNSEYNFLEDKIDSGNIKRKSPKITTLSVR